MRTAFRIVTSFMLLLALGFGGLTFSVHNQGAQLTSTLAAAQKSEANEIIPALHSLEPFLTIDDQALAASIENFFTRPLLPSVNDGVAQLSSGHHLLAVLLGHAMTDPTLSAREDFGILKRVLEGRGTSFTALNTYNQAALVWNEREKSSFGASIVNFYDLKKVPLLVPDGRTEFAPTIML